MKTLTADQKQQIANDEPVTIIKKSTAAKIESASFRIPTSSLKFDKSRIDEIVWSTRQFCW